jgi:CRISPR-associated protein Csm5
MFERDRNALATRYRLRVRSLSPVHVGSGEGDLARAALEFMPLGDRLAVLDPDKLTRGLGEAQLNRLWAGVPLAEIVEALRPDQLAEMAAYTLPAPRDRVDRIRPHIKIAGAPPRPYLPGSSVKGALRTALAWAMVRDGLVAVGAQDLGRSRYFADAAVERALFGSDPNHDLLRALHVGDTDGLLPGDALSLSQVSVYSLQRSGRLLPKGAQYRFHLETIDAGAEMSATARRDNYLLEPELAARLRWDKGRAYLIEVVRHANDFAARLIEQEADFYRRYGPPPLVGFYEQLAQVLAQVKAAGHTCLCQIAWGAGWTAKTVGTALDEATLARIKRDFNLGRTGSDIFPKTRRLVEVNGQPAAPLGWLMLTFQPEGEEVALPELPAIERRPSAPPAGRPARRPLSDLKIGEVVEGRVTNTTDFGAFVDIGAEKDGLIHVSQLGAIGGKRVERVEDVVQRGDRVKVEIVRLEPERRRIGLRLVGKK